MDALRTAWKELDLQQIMAGEKTGEGKPPDGEEKDMDV